MKRECRIGHWDCLVASTLKHALAQQDSLYTEVKPAIVVYYNWMGTRCEWKHHGLAWRRSLSSSLLPNNKVHIYGHTDTYYHSYSLERRQGERVCKRVQEQTRPVQPHLNKCVQPGWAPLPFPMYQFLTTSFLILYLPFTTTFTRLPIISRGSSTTTTTTILKCLSMRESWLSPQFPQTILTICVSEYPIMDI